MFADQYELLDFAAGRKLERFGAHLLNRPAPAATRPAQHFPELWSQAVARYDRAEGAQGQWSPGTVIETDWSLAWRSITLELKLTPFGQVGVFPEQAPNWNWISDQVRAAGRPIRLLNLFAYTGASTLIAAAAGAEVTHVDAAPGVVAWARRNAERSGLANAPIRWIAEDAVKFARRELKRGRRYDAVVLDPPAYGHGPRGEPWKLDEDLDELLSLCGELTADSRALVLLTCHSGELAFGGSLFERIVDRLPELRSSGILSSDDLSLISRDGQRLHCGAVVHWARHAEPSPAHALEAASAKTGR